MAKRSSNRWEGLSKQELLDVRICDLGLTLEGTWIEGVIEKVMAELRARDIRVRPHFWLSEEWFSPTGIPGVAIPFYLAHPRLMRLERSEVLEVEGGTAAECAKYLRHELGHAVDHAFRLSRRRRWQQVFGKSSAPYPEYYSPNPASRRFVVHLDGWYAQAHPSEDFAETFATWLRPRSRWRRRYADWPALKKLEYVDELLGELAGCASKVRSTARPHGLASTKKTLRQYYADKKAHYSTNTPTIYDEDLRQLFSSDPKHERQESAAQFLRRYRAEIRRLVARWTGQYEYALDLVFKEMIARARDLKLKAVGSERALSVDFAILLTVRIMQSVYSERHWIAV